MSGKTIEQRFVLLFASGIDTQRPATLAAESSQLASLLRDRTGSVEINVISLGLSRAIEGASTHIRLDTSPQSIPDRMLAKVGAFALRKWLASFSLGRLLNSLGPVDQGRIFWRTVRKNPAAVQLLKSSNIVIATDSAGAKTAWLAAHRSWVDEAFYDQRTASVGISWQLPSADQKPFD